VRETLDLAQYVDHLPNLLNDRGKACLEDFPVFNLSPDGKMMSEMSHHTMRESTELRGTGEQIGGTNAADGTSEPFKTTRELSLYIGYLWDQQKIAFVVQDEEMQSAISIRVHNLPPTVSIYI